MNRVDYHDDNDNSVDSGDEAGQCLWISLCWTADPCARSLCKIWWKRKELGLEHAWSIPHSILIQQSASGVATKIILSKFNERKLCLWLQSGMPVRT